jgi:hypothetical protein
VAKWSNSASREQEVAILRSLETWMETKSSRQAPAALLLVSRAGLTFFCGALALLPSVFSVLRPNLFLLVLKPLAYLILLFFSRLDLYSVSFSYSS